MNKWSHLHSCSGSIPSATCPLTMYGAYSGPITHRLSDDAGNLQTIVQGAGLLTSWRWRTPMGIGCAREQITDFLVRGLGKLFVPRTYGREGFGSQRTNDLIDFVP